MQADFRSRGPRAIGRISYYIRLLFYAPAAAWRWFYRLRRSMLIMQELSMLLWNLSTIRIGVVTGDNSFFVLSRRTAQRLHIANRYLRSILTRGPELRSLVFSPKEARELFSAETGSLLFVPPAKTKSKPVASY